jgi:NitT/TauT family transport system ATP-binding protein
MPDGTQAAPPPHATHPGQPVVTVDRVSVEYKNRESTFRALSDVSLDVTRGEFISLIGPSGCGKPTLLRLIADLAQPTAGTLRINGGTPTQARQDRSYGYVFQTPALYPWRTALPNVMRPLEIIRPHFF